MARLKITRASGEVTEHQITPKIEYLFELYAKKGMSKAFEDGKQTDLYYLAWECIKESGETIKLFGPEFLDGLKKVDVLDDLPF